MRIAPSSSASSAAIHCIVSSSPSPPKRHAGQSSLRAPLSQSAICSARLLQRLGLGLIFGCSGKIQTPVPSADHQLTLPCHFVGAQINVHPSLLVHAGWSISCILSSLFLPAFGSTILLLCRFRGPSSIWPSCGRRPSLSLTST